MIKLDKSKLVRNMANKYKLVPYLDKAFVEFEDEWGYKYTSKIPDDAWHPSGHCLPAPSELLAIARGEGKDSFSGLEKTFQVGHFWHQLLQYVVLKKLEFCTPEAVERRGTRVWEAGRPFIKGCDVLLPETEWVPKPFHWSTGAGDIAPLELPRGWRGVVDFKTMSAGMYNQKSIPDFFAKKYEAQINLYMDFFDEERAIILAICKDGSHPMKEWEYVRNQPLIDAIYDKWKFVAEALDAEVSIPEEYDQEFEVEHLLTGPVA